MKFNKKISIVMVLLMLLLPLQVPVQALAMTTGKIARVENKEQSLVNNPIAFAEVNQKIRNAVRGFNFRNAPEDRLVAKTVDKSVSSKANKIEIYYNQATGVANFIKADPLLSKEDSLKYFTGPMVSAKAKSTSAAMGALEKYKALLKVKSPLKEFRVKNEVADAAGLKHIKFAQQYNGISVWGKEIFVHLDNADNVYLIEGQTVITPELETSPQLSSQAANAAVISDLGRDAEVKTTELVIITDVQGDNLLVYHVEAYKGFHRWQYFINACSGSLVKKYNDTKAQAVAGYGVDLLNRNRNFFSWQEGSKYYLIDTSMTMHRRNPVLPGDYGQGNIAILNMQNQDYGDATFVSSGSPTQWDAAGVSALSNSIQTYGIYEKNFNRSGIDGNGGNIYATIHVSRNYDNAYWDGMGIYFGDGGEYFKPLAQSLDVTAHEITHGVIEYSANLIYENQSGALNEAVADIMACIVDDDDWLVGEDITRVSPGYLRSLSEPHSGLDPQPATMDEYQNLPDTEDCDYGGVHVNCSIPARAAYLMAEGLGAGKAIGREKMGQIWYKALTQHLTRSSEFIDARLATIQSAKELYGENSPEVEAVIAAWDAVKVTTEVSGGDGGEGDEGSVLEPVEGDDNLLFIYGYGDYYLWVRPANSAWSFPLSYSIPVFETRPVVLDHGKKVLFVDAYHNLWIGNLEGVENEGSFNFNEEIILDNGNIWSIAGSPDGRYLAYTTYETENTIYLVDLADDTGAGDRVYQLAFPAKAKDGKDKPVEYADVLEFELSGKRIIFDALSSVTVAEGEAIKYWNVGVLDLATGTIDMVLPAPAQGVDIGNPAASNTKDWLIALEFINNNTYTTSAVTVNTITGETGTIVESDPQGEYQSFRPVFNGDDSSIVLEHDGNVTMIPLAEKDGAYVGDTDAEQIWEMFASYPRVYRVGERSLEPEITIDKSSINFDSVAVGQTKSQSLIISNTGNYALNILGYQLNDRQFKHDGYVKTLAPGEAYSINVDFVPEQNGSQTAKLVINSDDADHPAVEVTLSGQGVSEARVLPAKYDVMPNKTWRIEFNTILDKNTVTMENIYVYDLKGNQLDCAVELADGKTVSVSPPQSGYTLWKTYTLFISTSVLSDLGKSLTKPVLMLFTIQG